MSETSRETNGFLSQKNKSKIFFDFFFSFSSFHYKYISYLFQHIFSFSNVCHIVKFYLLWKQNVVVIIFFNLMYLSSVFWRKNLNVFIIILSIYNLSAYTELHSFFFEWNAIERLYYFFFLAFNITYTYYITLPLLNYPY